MSQKPMLDFTLARHLAIEKQLLAEEKWIVEALKKIKKQRNSLQIERLHLTSELGKLMMKKKGSKTPKEGQEKSTSNDKEQETQEPFSFSMDDEVCNAEELNLTIPQHTFAHPPVHTSLDNIEEFENSEMDDYEIDMNMLMNGQMD